MTDVTSDSTYESVPTQAEGVAVDATTPVEAESVEVPQEPEAPRLNVEEYGSHLVPIVVDGEEQWVTLEEARRGYSRTSDYTRKTQELATSRQELARAEALYNNFKADPQGTLTALAEHFGVSLAEARDIVEDAGDMAEQDPNDQRLSAIEQRFQEQEAAEARSRIESEFKELRDTYGEFDDQEVINAALERNITVTDAFKLVNFGKVQAKAATEAKEAEVLQAKRDVQVVEDGGAVRRGAVKPAAKTPNSIREAYEMAVQQAR
jgi:hypothetical protein